VITRETLAIELLAGHLRYDAFASVFAGAFLYHSFVPLFVVKLVLGVDNVDAGLVISSKLLTVFAGTCEAFRSEKADLLATILAALVPFVRLIRTMHDFDVSCAAKSAAFVHFHLAVQFVHDLQMFGVRLGKVDVVSEDGEGLDVV